MPSGVCEGVDNAEAEEEAARRKKIPTSGKDGKSMRQAQEEDYRREQMAELERSAPAHIYGYRRRGWRLSVPCF